MKFFDLEMSSSLAKVARVRKGGGRTITYDDWSVGDGGVTCGSSKYEEDASHTLLGKCAQNGVVWLKGTSGCYYQNEM